MLERVSEPRSQEHGFTLTELLITVVILGVLAGIVVFAVSSFTDDGKQVACEADRRNVEIAAEAYRAHNGTYPSGADDAARIGELVTLGYLKQVPQADKGYLITLSAAGAVGPADCSL